MRIGDESAAGSRARGWRSADVGPASAWRVLLPERLGDKLVAISRALGAGTTPLVETRLDDTGRRAWAGEFTPIRETLEVGRGFVIIEGPSGDDLSDRERVALYWVVGQLLGQPVLKTSRACGSTTCATRGRRSARVPGSP